MEAATSSQHALEREEWKWFRHGIEIRCRRQRARRLSEHRSRRDAQVWVGLRWLVVWTAEWWMSWCILSAENWFQTEKTNQSVTQHGQKWVRNSHLSSRFNKYWLCEIMQQCMNTAHMAQNELNVLQTTHTATWCCCFYYYLLHLYIFVALPFHGE